MGEGTIKTIGSDGVQKFRSIGRDRMFKKLGILPSLIEMTIARARLFQSIFRDMEHHEQIITILAGRLPFEESVVAGPWVSQFMEDLERLTVIDSIAWMCEAVIESGISLLIQNEEIREAYVNFDPKELKARYFSMAIPPCKLNHSACKAVKE
eukprot:4132157-Lingulodinium_polyedra.AAC.1